MRIKVFTKNDEKNQNSIEFMDEGQVKVRGNGGIKQLIITMSENEEGFQYPHIDTSKCVDCGLCQCVCPTQMENISVLFHVTPQTVSAAWNLSLIHI